ncbi:MAG TPA: radical SAM protein [Dehalococcoidia bacterium]|nr:radical SAM protein [Dehalococcoidia bacterium]
MIDLNQFKFEQGPIRPPSEAYSLLIRVTRNCPWNRCLFCGIYKNTKFELRPAEDVIEDVKKAKAISDEIRALSGQPGQDSFREAAASIYNQLQYDWSVRNVAMWLWAGAKSVFLQDANSLIMRTPELVRVLNFLRETFPQVERITSYARSNTAAKKTLDELIAIKNAGLTRLHIGFESGSDTVLEFIQKGVTAAQHIQGGVKVRQAGIELSEYFIPGLGGRKWSEENAVESAETLNKIDPDFIRIRSMMLSPNHPLWAKIQSGEYEPQNDDEIVEELGKFVARLELNSYLVSDHITNLLPEVEGKFPEAKSACLEIINRYLTLPDNERNNYKLGRRMGIYNSLDDIRNPAVRSQVDNALFTIEQDKTKDLDDILNRLKIGIAI